MKADQKSTAFVLSCLLDQRSSSVSQLCKEPGEINILCKTLTSVQVCVSVYVACILLHASDVCFHFGQVRLLTVRILNHFETPPSTVIEVGLSLMFWINLILMIVNRFLLCRSRACFCPRLCSGFVLSDSSFICLFLCPLMFSPEQTSWLCFLIQSSSDSVYFSWDTFPQKKDAPTKCVSLVCSGWWHRGAPVSICHTAPSRACASNSEWLQRETSPFEETEMWYSAVCSTKWIFAGGK